MSKKILLISILCLFIFMSHNLENKKSISKKKNVGGMEQNYIIAIIGILSIVMIYLFLLKKHNHRNSNWLQSLEFTEVPPNKFPFRIPPDKL
tara:strand:- start:2174 stop:2449 length:276 start_codon:yes stop_codon:yes gene_type:complete